MTKGMEIQKQELERPPWLRWVKAGDLKKIVALGREAVEFVGGNGWPHSRIDFGHRWAIVGPPKGFRFRRLR